MKKTFNRVTSFALAFCLAATLAFGQASITTTTLASALPATLNAGSAQSGGSVVYVNASTNINAPGFPYALGGIGSPQGAPPATFLYVDRELMRVNGSPVTVGTTYAVPVERGVEGTPATSHASGATVYVGPGSYFPKAQPSGSCSATTLTVLPYILITDGTIWTCPTTAPGSGTWVKSGTVDTFRFTDGYFFVPASACWFFPTTYTNTVILTVAGASNTPVLQTTTNSATGTETLQCTITVPSRLTSGKGVTINDVTTLYGIQTTASTSMTVSMATIAYPTPAATETASTVTPVAVSGTVTNNTVTDGLGTSTAGAFWSVKSTLATPLAINTDLQQIIYSLGFVSTTSGVHVINTPGLIVHYTLVPL